MSSIYYILLYYYILYEKIIYSIYVFDIFMIDFAIINFILFLLFMACFGVFLVYIKSYLVKIDSISEFISHEPDESDEEELRKQQEDLLEGLVIRIKSEIGNELDGVRKAITGNLGANTKSLLQLEKLNAKQDKEAMYEGMVEMLPGLETLLDAFNMKKSVKKNPDKIMEYLAIADLITKGQATKTFQDLVIKLQGQQMQSQPQATTPGLQLPWMK